MYILKNGLGMPWLGSLFALLTALAAFGIGNMVQANSVAGALQSTLYRFHRKEKDRATSVRT